MRSPNLTLFFGILFSAGSHPCTCPRSFTGSITASLGCVSCLPVHSCTQLWTYHSCKSSLGSAPTSSNRARTWL